MHPRTLVQVDTIVAAAAGEWRHQLLNLGTCILKHTLEHEGYLTKKQTCIESLSLITGTNGPQDDGTFMIWCLAMDLELHEPDSLHNIHPDDRDVSMGQPQRGLYLYIDQTKRCYDGCTIVDGSMSENFSVCVSSADEYNEQPDTLELDNGMWTLEMNGMLRG